jgi:hypothetical protein
MSEVSSIALESRGSKADKVQEPSSLTIAQELAIHFSTEGRPVFDRFMIEYVGHPNPRLRLEGARPTLTRQRFKPNATDIFEYRDKFTVVDYRHELFAGFSKEGSLLLAMIASEATDDPDNFLVVLAHSDGTVQEPRILRTAAQVDDDSFDVQLRMMGGLGARNAPPRVFPDTQSQWQLSVRDDENGPTASLRFGRGRAEEFLPIEDLCEAMDERSQFQQISKGGLTLVFSRNL